MDFNPKKFLIIFFALLNITLFLFLWILKNQEVALFLLQNPIVILPYLIDKLGFIKFLVLVLLTIGFFVFVTIFSFPQNLSKPSVVRGTEVSLGSQLQTRMKTKCLEENSNQQEKKSAKYDNFQIAGIPIPKSVENRGFFFLAILELEKVNLLNNHYLLSKNALTFEGLFSTVMAKC